MPRFGLTRICLHCSASIPHQVSAGICRPGMLALVRQSEMQLATVLGLLWVMESANASAVVLGTLWAQQLASMKALVLVMQLVMMSEWQ